VTGFLVPDAASAANVVAHAAALDRAEIRKVAEQRFGVQRMVDEYVAVYERVLGLSHRRE
jgi:hypothetical protein